MTLAEGVICLLLMICVTEAGRSKTETMYNQSSYVRHEANPLTYDAAHTACMYTDSVLDLPLIDDPEVHYRWPPILQDLRTYWYWAPMRKKVADSWRWSNGTLVDLNQDDTRALATQPTASEEECSVWQLGSSFKPVSCEERHHFICLNDFGEPCRLRPYNKIADEYYMDIAAYQYTVHESMEDAIAMSTVNSTPVLFKPGLDGRLRRDCKDECDRIHLDVDNPLGCWFAQHFVELDKEERCVLLLSPAMPDVLYDIVVMENNTAAQFFRTCLFQFSYENESCPLDCSCLSPKAPTTVEESEEEEKKIKADLTLSTHNLSATVRRKTSAPDPRPSAQGVGWVGVTVAGVFLLTVVILDLTSLWRDLSIMATNVKEFCGRDKVGT